MGLYLKVQLGQSDGRQAQGSLHRRDTGTDGQDLLRDSRLHGQSCLSVSIVAVGAADAR